MPLGESGPLGATTGAVGVAGLLLPPFTTGAKVGKLPGEELGAMGLIVKVGTNVSLGVEPVEGEAAGETDGVLPVSAGEDVVGGDTLGIVVVLGVDPSEGIETIGESVDPIAGAIDGELPPFTGAIVETGETAGEGVTGAVGTITVGAMGDGDDALGDPFPFSDGASTGVDAEGALGVPPLNVGTVAVGAIVGPRPSNMGLPVTTVVGEGAGCGAKKQSEKEFRKPIAI